jgi:hypothetical protein
MRRADQEACDHDNYCDPDNHGFALCLDCSALLSSPIYYLVIRPESLSLPEWWDSLWKGEGVEDWQDSDPGDCQ